MVGPDVVERAHCDAQHLGRVDTATPTRVTTDVSASTRAAVWRRDGGRCRVPGCRSTRHLEIHHLDHRAAGGGHTKDNLCLLCDGHHDAHHKGKLIIEGSIATGLVFRHADGRPYGPHVEPRPPGVVADAVSALRNVGSHRQRRARPWTKRSPTWR